MRSVKPIEDRLFPLDLEPVTRAVNVARRSHRAGARQRTCRTCKNATSQRYRARKKANA